MEETLRCLTDRDIQRNEMVSNPGGTLSRNTVYNSETVISASWTLETGAVPSNSVCSG